MACPHARFASPGSSVEVFIYITDKYLNNMLYLPSVIMHSWGYIHNPAIQHLFSISGDAGMKVVSCEKCGNEAEIISIANSRKNADLIP